MVTDCRKDECQAIGISKYQDPPHTTMPAGLSLLSDRDFASFIYDNLRHYPG